MAETTSLPEQTLGAKAFRDILAAGTPVVFDGGMGTSLYEQGILHTRAFEESNLTAASKVKAIHISFIEAGANVIETNTFSANKYCLQRFGIDNVAEINTAGVKIAKEAALECGKGTIVAGAVGPTGEGAGFIDDDKAQEIADAYRVQLKALVEGGVDVVVLETFQYLAEIRIALQVAKEVFLGPVIASMSFTDEPAATNFYAPSKVARLLQRWGADVVGVNCGGGWGRVGEGGPSALYDVAEEMLKEVGSSVPVYVCPNAGHPKRIGQRSVYMATGEYFLVYAKRLFKAGVRMVGLSTDKPVATARKLREGGVDVINIADGPRATVRMSNTALAQAIQDQVGTETIVHMCCRDRNLLGLMSDLLGNHTRSLKNMVVITGDPPKMGDYPKATAVFDVDSIGLLKMIKGLNAGLDPAGKKFDGQASFFPATGAEPGAVDYAREMRRLRDKIDAGAELIMTQPVYDSDVMQRFLDDVAALPKPVPVLLGLCPLVSARNAEFLHNEVPGMSVPQVIRDRMAKAGGGPAGQAEGVAIAKEMLAQFADQVVGCYVMPQLGKYDLALEVLSELGYGKADSASRRDAAAPPS